MKREIKNSVRITRIQKIKEVCNDMCHNWYYLVYGRIYTKDRKAFQRFKYVVWFDVFDVCEYYEKDGVTSQEIKNYSFEVATAFVPSFDMIAENCTDFLNDCNQTIERYNGLNDCNPNLWC